MRNGKLQFGVKLLAVAASVAIPVLCGAQNPHPDRPPQHQGPAPQGQTRQVPTRPPSSRQAYPQPTNPNRPSANGNRAPYNSAQPNQGPRSNFNNGFNNGANNHNGVRNGAGAGYVPTPRQQVGVGAARPWVDQMRDLSPRQRDQVLQNSKAFQGLSPDKQTKIRQQFNQWDHMTRQQQYTLRENEATWRKLTPDQRNYIRNDVLPRMRQMPWDRQQIINQKLGILKNMPESARNQRLNDPNFTRGMSDEEKSTLHDLAHMHVGAPDPPSE